MAKLRLIGPHQRGSAHAVERKGGRLGLGRKRPFQAVQEAVNRERAMLVSVQSEDRSRSTPMAMQRTTAGVPAMGSVENGGNGQIEVRDDVLR